MTRGFQRPVTQWLHWFGHKWPIRLRVAPGSRRRIVVPGPSNDNAWSGLERLATTAQPIGDVLKAFRFMAEMHDMLRVRPAPRLQRVRP
jgi:hypothetical protein